MFEDLMLDVSCTRGAHAPLAQSNQLCEHPTHTGWLCHYNNVLRLGGPWLGIPHFTMESGHWVQNALDPLGGRRVTSVVPWLTLHYGVTIILHHAPPKEGQREAEFCCIDEIFLYYHGGGDVDISLGKKHIFLFKKLYSSHRFHRLYSSKREMYALHDRGWMPEKMAVHVLQDFLFLTFLLTIKIWHFHSTMLILSSLCSCIVGEWHPLTL